MKESVYQSLSYLVSRNAFEMAWSDFFFDDKLVCEENIKEFIKWLII
jgi:hypothetical protein